MIILATPAGGSGPVDALSMGLWLWLQFDSTDFSNAELQSSTSGSSNLDVPRMSSTGIGLFKWHASEMSFPCRWITWIYINKRQAYGLFNIERSMLAWVTSDRDTPSTCLSGRNQLTNFPVYGGCSTNATTMHYSLLEEASRSPTRNIWCEKRLIIW